MEEPVMLNHCGTSCSEESSCYSSDALDVQYICWTDLISNTTLHERY